MTFKVLNDNAPELLKISEPIEIFDEALSSFAQELILTMVAYRGIGIAAPQVGKNIRLIVVKINNQNIVMINPEIIFNKGFYVSMEGCLSVLNKKVQKTRAKTVKISYKDLDGNSKSVILNALEAACVQHEIDHLDGILITS